VRDAVVVVGTVSAVLVAVVVALGARRRSRSGRGVAFPGTQRSAVRSTSASPARTAVPAPPRLSAVASSDTVLERMLAAAFGLGPHPDDLRRAYLSEDIGGWLARGEDPVRVIAEHFDVSEKRVLAAIRDLPLDIADDAALG